MLCMFAEMVMLVFVFVFVFLVLLLLLLHRFCHELFEGHVVAFFFGIALSLVTC